MKYQTGNGLIAAAADHVIVMKRSRNGNLWKVSQSHNIAYHNLCSCLWRLAAIVIALICQQKASRFKRGKSFHICQQQQQQQQLSAKRKASANCCYQGH